MTEIKYRGPLTNKQLERLRKYLKQNGKLIKSAFEEVIFFDTSIFPQIGDFVTGFSRVSLKSDSRGLILRIKEGNPSNPIRDEIAIDVKKKQCVNLIYFLNHLGLKYGYYRPAHREEYALGKIVVSIKTKCVMDNHFELELKKGVSMNNTEIASVLNKLNLHLWSKEKYQQRINSKMLKFPTINVYESQIWKKFIA